MKIIYYISLVFVGLTTLNFFGFLLTFILDIWTPDKKGVNEFSYAGAFSKN